MRRVGCGELGTEKIANIDKMYCAKNCQSVGTISDIQRLKSSFHFKKIFIGWTYVTVLKY